MIMSGIYWTGYRFTSGRSVIKSVHGVGISHGERVPQWEPYQGRDRQNQDIIVGGNRYNIFINLLCKRSEEKIRVNTHINAPNLKMRVFPFKLQSM